MRFVMVFALVFLLAGAMADCVEMRVQGPSVHSVDQFSSRAVRVGITNYCDDADVSLSVDADFPVVLDRDYFSLSWGETEYFYLTLSPMNAKGIHEVVLSADNGVDVFDEIVAVKTEEKPAPLTIFAPTIASFNEEEVPVVWVSLNNRGDVVLNNIVLVAEVGDKKVFYDSFLSLDSGERDSIRFSLGDLGLGSHDVEIRALAGDFSVERSLTVKVNPASVPVSTVANVRGVDGAYVVEYTVFNNGNDLENLFVTVEDAPSSWNVISPPVFDLAHNESESMEVILEHDDIDSANVTVSLYSNAMLLTEEELELYPTMAFGPTGFFLVGSSLGWGIVFFVVVGALYFVFSFVKNYKEMYEREHGEMPTWWPFG